MINRSLFLGVIVMVTLMAIGTASQAVQSLKTEHSNTGRIGAAPIAIAGDSIYIAWPTNRTGNDEVNFRASSDGGTTFTDKINLSNSTGAESQDVEIAADGDNILITWWERNATSNEPVARISSDNGATFGPLLKLAANGTIGEQG